MIGQTAARVAIIAEGSAGLKMRSASTAAPQCDLPLFPSTDIQISQRPIIPGKQESRASLR